MKIKSVVFLSILIFILTILSINVFADEAELAADILAEGFESAFLLTDGDERSHTLAQNGGNVTVSRNEGISFIYIVFDRIPKKWTLTDLESGARIECGTNSFLHEYVDVYSLFGRMPSKVRLTFESGTSIDEIYAFGDGDIPKWVQRWSPPCDKADIMLLSSHSDDEQLFFAGVLPIYAGEKCLNVQVVYLVNHFLNEEEYARLRPHEQLDGLWTVGVRNYPVMSSFPDPYSESLEGAVEAYGAYGFTYDDFTEYITGCIRRFKPLVVVTHDVNGEYGHGTHILCAAALKDSLKLAADESSFPTSAEEYGVWQVEKTYLHLYQENRVVLDLDSPLSRFGGKTAFEVTRDGFSCHKSQHWTWFYGWIYGKDGKLVSKATDIEKYSPCYYGLYSTTVGYDIVGGDFMENVDSYAVRDAREAADNSGDQTDGNLSSDTAETEGGSPINEIKSDGSDKKAWTFVWIAAVSASVLIIAAVAIRIKTVGTRKKHRRRKNR